MKHEKILRRENGLKVKITAGFYCDFRGHNYSHHVEVCDKRKRNYRAPKPAEAPTDDEVYAVNIELWEKMKP